MRCATLIAIILIAIVLGSCARDSDENTEGSRISSSPPANGAKQEKEEEEMTPLDLGLAEKLDFDKEVLSLIKSATNQEFEPLYALEGKELRGITFSLPAAKAKETVLNLREQLLAKDYLIFISNANFGLKPDKIGIIKGDNQFEILRVKGTNGDNCGIGNEDVISRLRKWDSRYSLEIIGADYDWVEARMKILPEDMDEFAQEVYEFCPDVVDQGTETVENLARDMKNSRTVYLWWD